MHAPSTPATGSFPMLCPSLLLLQQLQGDLLVGGGWGWNRGLGLGLCSQSQRKTWASEGLFSAHICSLQLS